MIIDIHTHTFPDKIAQGVVEQLGGKAHIPYFSDATNGKLIDSMKTSGIDLSVVLPVATAERQVEKLNDASAKLNEIYGDQGILSFGAMHPDYENYRAELQRVLDLGLNGIKIHPVYQGVDIDDTKFLNIIDRAAELGLIVLTHAGLDIGYPGEVKCSPKMCRNVIDKVGDFDFILAHMGGWKNWEEVPEYLAETKAYLDTAFSTDCYFNNDENFWSEEDRTMLDKDQFVSMVRTFGAERILFGTDSPWSNQKSGIDFIESTSLLEDEKEKILGANAKKLLAI